MIDADTSCPDNIPAAIFEGIKDYVINGHAHGNFITAVLENNLRIAVGHADRESYEALRAILAFMTFEIPSQCHGSRDKVGDWITMGGQRGLAEARAAHEEAQDPRNS